MGLNANTQVRDGRYNAVAHEQKKILIDETMILWSADMKNCKEPRKPTVFLFLIFFFIFSISSFPVSWKAFIPYKKSCSVLGRITQN